MGKTFAMSGIMDWLKAASIRKMSAKRERETSKKAYNKRSKHLRRRAKRS